ncbi:MAG: hypothetical protein PHC28_10870 [Flavobacterium sp.]|uniref:hypothetical protein n=1 Tax=Flavobacterium sp. TaxID=239 RepID=UPI00262A4543|nr:hypothetical protein [Flavobacterium sp.]MDD5150958.1 hypothetical protein [Flavobacterium sp.]
MINKIIVYDDNDFELGEYFETSYQDITDNVSLLNYVTTNSVDGMTCNIEHISDLLSAFNQKPSIFVGISHGNEDEMVMHNCGAYVNATNAHNFSNSLVFSATCRSAKNLGPLLLTKGCNSFIGFIDDALATYDEFYHLYTACENYCIKEFLNTEKSLQTSYDEMMDYFDNQINLLFEGGGDEVLVGMELQSNKDCLVLLGNQSALTKSYYNI